MNRLTILIGLGAAAVILAIALNFVGSGDDEEFAGKRPPPPSTSNTRDAPTAPPAEKPKQSASVPTDRPSSPPAVTAEPAPRPEKPDTNKRNQDAPSFDVVRVNPQGDAVIAGRAAPGSRVEILDGGKVLGEVVADDRGEWVFIPTSPLPPGSRQLSLRTVGPDGKPLESESNVVLAVPEPGKDIAGRQTDKPAGVLALKVPRRGDGATQVLQQPTSDGTPGAPIPLSVASVDYDDEGNLTISGKARAKAPIHLYLNNQFVGRTSSADNGIWRARPKDAVAPGIYTLRADQVDDAGKAQARVEVIFARSVPLRGVPPGSLVVVEPGNSLWRIARRTYGSGFRYTVIYEANKRQIKDEDVIFPGQVFSLPSIN